MIQEIVYRNDDLMGGAAVFKGTRVPIETLFDHLEEGIGIDEFLQDFPSVSRSQVIDLLDSLNELLKGDKLTQIYEIAS